MVATMTPTLFATFKYQHTGAVQRSTGRKVFTGLAALVALGVLVQAFVPGLVVLIVPVVAWFSAPRHLLLGPRYLLCGDRIVYYANVRRVVASASRGTLRLVSASGQSFTLERDKFPTAARKADKIAKNKAAKFDKVAAKITERVQALAPGVECSGA